VRRSRSSAESLPLVDRFMISVAGLLSVWASAAALLGLGLNAHPDAFLLWAFGIFYFVGSVIAPVSKNFWTGTVYEVYPVRFMFGPRSSCLR